MNDKPSPQDVALFRASMADVNPVTTDKVAHDLPKPPPHPEQTRKDEAQVMRELLSIPNSPDPAELQPDEMVSFLRPGIQQTVIRKLRRGHYRVSAEIDLHGMSAAVAKQALVSFIQEARADNDRCVRIIHGKGRRSSNQGPVLKPMVSRWLQQRDDVLAFCSARPVDGGTGAIYVLLKNPAAPHVRY